MPHLILEYSDNIDSTVKSAELLKRGHAVMIASGLFTASDIKTRAYKVEQYLVGEKRAEGSFLHASVKLLAGRTPEQRLALSAPLFDLFSAALPESTSVTVDIIEMTRETYKKRLGAL